jgi:hypothetical protein
MEEAINQDTRYMTSRDALSILAEAQKSLDKIQLAVASGKAAEFYGRVLELERVVTYLKNDFILQGIL